MTSGEHRETEATLLVLSQDPISVFERIASIEGRLLGCAGARSAMISVVFEVRRERVETDAYRMCISRILWRNMANQDFVALFATWEVAAIRRWRRRQSRCVEVIESDADADPRNAGVLNQNRRDRRCL